MPELERPGGTRIHYEVQGSDGPALVMGSYWSWSPEVWAEMLADLADDHRVATYHLRGTGDSSRNGPYDMETDIGDLEAVGDALGGPAVLLSTADGSNRAAKLAARRPDLVAAAVCFGTAPFARAAFEGEEGMIASTTVTDAFAEMLESSYRGAMRTLIEATNPQASEDELRERVNSQVEFCPEPATIERFRQWVEDDPREEARAAGERLWIFAAAGIAGGWLPPVEVLERLTAESLPQATVLKFDEAAGPTSEPHQVADEVRRVSAPLREAVQGRK
ncbi:MAG: alpha/beta fold hydrolase [Solirubrobacterales bacterium]